MLKIGDRAPGRGRLVWNWKQGEATSVADLGTPSTSGGYVLCLYDEVGASPGLIAEWDAESAGVCDGVACWSQSASSVSFRDSKLEHGAIRRLSVSSGDAGRAKIKVRAQGPALAPPRLPLSLAPSARMQLHNLETGVCWESVFTTAETNVDGAFEATGD